MSRMEARRRKASALRVRFSKSLANLRQRLSQAKVRSTTHRRGRTSNLSQRGPLDDFHFEAWQGCLAATAEDWALITAIGEDFGDKGNPEQCAQNTNATVAILNVGGMNDG